MAILVFEHSDLSGSDRLGTTLRDAGHRLRVVSVHRDEPIPADLGEVDGILSCGGPQSVVGADVPAWLEAEMNLIRAAHERELPVVGLCLGCQIVGRALGGEVATMDGGGEYGWHRIELTPAGREDPLHAGLPWWSVQAQWHGDYVRDLPQGARPLATSERCPTQAWALGLRTYGFQYHPEVDAGAIDRWAADDPACVQSAGTSRDALAAETERQYPAFERISQRLLDGISLFLMPVDRRYEGVAKDLHH